MENTIKTFKFEDLIISIMGKIPVLSYYSKSRGWSFLISWGHRLAGLTLVAYMFAHIYTLSHLFSPETYDAEMKLLDHFVFSFLEWAVAIPVIFHALNGGRLILYELFEVRKDEMMIRWMAALGIIYVIIVGFFFVHETPQASASFFWSTALFLAIIALIIIVVKIWTTGNSMLWKLQRITAAFMFPLLIGHMFFMHMNYLTAHDSKTILLRLESPFIRGIDLAFVVFLLFHAGYGLYSVITDYLKPGPLLKILAFLVIFVMALSAYFGIKLILIL